MASKVSPLTPRARSLRRGMTDAERALWRRLRNGQLHDARFRRQAVIGRFIADFACFAPKLVVELDGGQHAAAASYDDERSSWLIAEGFTVLRFWNNEVLGNLDGVVTAIEMALERARTRHDPPP